MNKKKKLQIRLDEKLLEEFKNKSIKDFGSMSAFIDYTIKSYLAEKPLAQNPELTALLYAINALNSYTNNINQIAKKINSGKDIIVSEKQIMEVKYYTQDVVKNFRKCLKTRQLNLDVK